MNYKNILFSHRIDPENLDINIAEIYRYMGIHISKVSNAEKELVMNNINSVMKAMSLRGVYIISDACVYKNEVQIGDAVFESANLAKNMRGCSYACMFVITCGQGVDRLISKYSHISPSSALAISAIATAVSEEYADIVCRDIAQLVYDDNLFLRPRFSPGYGDLSINYQTDIIRITDSGKRIGVTLTDDLMMLPSKSVSAIIGLSEYDSGCTQTGCEFCNKADCLFRRNILEDKA